jgi:hypothetical protein
VAASPRLARKPQVRRFDALVIVALFERGKGIGKNRASLEGSAGLPHSPNEYSRMAFVRKMYMILGAAVLGGIVITVVMSVVTLGVSAAVPGGSGNSSSSSSQQAMAAAPVLTQQSGQPHAAAPTPVALPTVGGEAQSGGWKIGLQKMDTASQLGQSKYSKGTAAQGKFVVLTVSATNLQKQTSVLNDWDFQ